MTSKDAGKRYSRRVATNASQLNDRDWLNDHNATLKRVSSVTSRKLSAPRLFVFSATDKAAFNRYMVHLRDYLCSLHGRNDSSCLDDLAHTLAERRSDSRYRSYIIAEDTNTLAASLDANPDVFRASAAAPSLLFAFTGQGAQWFNMARELLHNPVFARSVRSADNFFNDKLLSGWSVLDELTRPASNSRINQAEFSQPLCAVIQVALVDLLSSCGIMPKAVIGFSSGEIAAGYAAGALTAEAAWTLAFHRGRLCRVLTCLHPELEGELGMMVVGLSPREIEEHLSEVSDSRPVFVACCNSSGTVTLSGNRTTLGHLEEKFRESGIFARQLKVELAYHSPYMRLIAREYFEAVRHIRPRASAGGVVMYSTVTGEIIEGRELNADYWVKHMCSPVQFVSALENAFLPDVNRRRGRNDSFEIPFNGVLEIGPHSALQGQLTTFLARIKQTDDVFYLSTLERNKNAYITFLETAGALWSRGYPVKLEEVNLNALTRPEIVSDLPSHELPMAILDEVRRMVI